MRKRRKDSLKFSAVFILSLLLLGCISSLLIPTSRGNPDQSGVSVINVAPNISDAQLKKINHVYRLKVIASDYNGWQDISQINLTILDKKDTTMASGGYIQYKNDTKIPTEENRIDDFSNFEGSPLVTEECTVKRPRNSSSVEDKTDMELVFYFLIDGGWTVLLNIKDTHQLSASMEVTFPSIMSGIYNISPFLIVIAAATAVYISYRKFKQVIWMEVK